MGELREMAKWKPGYQKIKKCCMRAVKDNYEWLWIDSCCIDKRSSAELSEAINSMYKWYQNSRICYVYLVDVPGSTASTEVSDEMFSKSRWFARAWTLQELLAPWNIHFFGQDWNLIGTSTPTLNGKSLKVPFLSKLARITGITKEVLRNSSFIYQTSISQRMSWAASRQATREEDIAYALMGKFGVNMPILYGEGQQKAFMRLQLEIVKSSPDQTIFAWKSDHQRGSSGLFANSPLEFADSGAFYAYNPWATTIQPHSMTNLGLPSTYLFVNWKMSQMMTTFSLHSDVGLDRRTTQRGSEYI